MQSSIELYYEKIKSTKLEDTIRSDIIKKAASLDEDSRIIKKRKKLNSSTSMNKINVEEIDKKWQDFLV